MTKSSKPRVAILTSLIDYSPAYSLVGIILDQARMLQKRGYEYDLLCIKNFNERDKKAMEAEGLNIRYVLPQTRLVDYQPNQAAKEDDPSKDTYNGEGFESQAKIHFEGRPEEGQLGYRHILKDYDVIIDHDLMFLSWHLPQNLAIRKCIELWPEKNWLHWVHSGPSSPPDDLCYPSTLRFSAAPHSHYVYLNETQRFEYSLMISCPKKLVYTVYNPKDIRDVYGFGKETCDFIERYQLFDHDILQVYPFSTPRWKDKGIKQLMKLWGFWKRQGVRARLVLINAHCNNPVDVPRVKAIEACAKLNGLVINDDVIMTSSYSDETAKKEWRYTVPFRLVRELMLMSNMFIFPSISECCSLIQAEAEISGGTFLVLNRDFTPMLEFGSENVLTYEFTKNDPDKNPSYYECVAREIWANFRQESTIAAATQARNKYYNKDWIFRTQLEPLLYLGFSRKDEIAAERQGEVLRPEFQQDRPPGCERPGGEIELEAPDGTIHKAQITKAFVKRPKQPVAPTEAPAGDVEVKVKQEVPTPKADYNNPQDGMSCELFGACSSTQKEECFSMAGHCMMLDELKVEE